ncbi:hypothetical protein GALMADRAFT_82940 [Galerina marginata CBS 339.88]|uniref:BZIP domain-containing protein n=1 Tax=Galerina marginata (strain CBS 339.88) TaxID=685588 RepID=A0A067TNP3_GALM3|nr:hypothetical protein GALMADRAFT_82940 [Galerina marginata CBS 339.88]
MDREQPSDSRNTQRSRSTSSSNPTGQPNPDVSKYHSSISLNFASRASIPSDIQDAALLAQFAAAAGTGDLSNVYANMLSQNPYPSMSPSPGFYGNFLHHNPMPPPQLPPLSSLDFPWHALPPHQSQAGPGSYDSHQPTASTSLPNLPHLDTQYGSLPQMDSTRGSRRGQQSPSTSRSSQGHSTSSPEVELTDAERLAMADEKRRRNTAASARFRIKKKHKTINLERSVSDLTGRAEELEREAADLRRENGWLKEIVMLKGTHFAASNQAHREALSQAVASASTSGQITSTGTAGPSGSTPVQPEESVSGSSESESSDNEEISYDKKGKGKQTSRKK